MVLCFAFAVVSRLTGIVYSFFATDVLYQGSFFLYSIDMLRLVLSAVSTAFAAIAAMFCVINRRKYGPVIWLYTAVITLDAAAAVLYDYFNGALEGRVLFGILYRIGLVLYAVLLLIIGIAIARYMLSQKKPPILAVVFAAALSSAIDLLALIWNSVGNLIEWEFLPSPSEVKTMLIELAAAALACAFSILVAVFFTKKKFPRLTLKSGRS